MTKLLFASALETGAPDPRQQKFLATAGKLAAEGFEMIGMEGFRASKVDLAWLADEILDYVDTVPGCRPKRLGALIGEELPQVVQRLKGWSYDPAEWPESVSLSFETKDDLGTYEYRLSVHL